MVFPILGGNNRKEVERKFANFSETLGKAFAQIKSDIGEVNNRVEANQRELTSLQQWIDYLHRYNQHISASHPKITQKYDKIAESHQKLHSSHTELHTDHLKTAKIAENLENKHQELSKAISGHKEELKNELQNQLKLHKDASGQELARMKSWVDYLSAHINSYNRKEGDLKQHLAKLQDDWAKANFQLRDAVNGLKAENSELKQSFTVLQKELKASKEELETTKNLTKNTINEAKSEVFRQLESLKPIQQSLQVPIQPVIQQVSAPMTQVNSTFQKHIMARVLPNRKGYVLKFILDLIANNTYSTKELEEIVVNEKQLCGRTSFYAYLKELKLKGRINYAEIDERQILVSTDTQQRLQ